MTDATRAAIAFLAGTLITGRRRGGVYDYRRSRFVALSLALERPQVLIHSASERVHLHGQISPTVIHLQDFTTNRQLRLTIQGQSFSGYDEFPSSDFSGLLHGNLICVFEDEGRKHWNYSL